MNLKIVNSPKLEFMPGDVVRLKSGGCSMTIASVVSPEVSYLTGTPSGILCHWQNVDGVPYDEIYKMEQLKKV